LEPFGYTSMGMDSGETLGRSPVASTSAEFFLSELFISN